MRKVIQIATTSVPATEHHDTQADFYALCDDGSMWDYSFRHKNWQRMPDIPQDDPTREGSV